MNLVRLIMKKKLCNNISNKILKQKMLFSKTQRITLSFYKYFYLDDTLLFRDNLYIKFSNIKVLGRIYIANEGINAQISVPKNNYFKMKKIVRNMHISLKDVFMNNAIDNYSKSFWSLRIKIRKKIVSDGIEDNNFIFIKNKKYLSAKKINEVIEKKTAILIDVRNDYEYEIGHFKNSINITSKVFREQVKKITQALKNYKNKKIVLYCTGGIRCEKTSSWMQYCGFKYVYQMQGGILQYVKTVKEKKIKNYFEGKIFVFDYRMQEKNSKKIISKCYQCNDYCDNHINCNNNLCHMLFIQCLKCFKKFKGYCSNNCIQNHININ